MSHSLGVMCSTCREVLVTDNCPERGCPGRHGYGFQESSRWAAAHWPKHACFIPTPKENT